MVSMEQYSLLSLHYMTIIMSSRHMIQQLSVIGCNATISPQLVEIQTPLIQFVVDLLCSLLYSKSTTNCISGDWA